MRTDKFVIICYKNNDRDIFDFIPEKLRYENSAILVEKIDESKSNDVIFEKLPGKIIINYRKIQLTIWIDDKSQDILNYLKSNPVSDFQLFYERWLSIPDQKIFDEIWSNNFYTDEYGFEWVLFRLEYWIDSIMMYLQKLKFNKKIIILIKTILEKATLFDIAEEMYKDAIESNSYCILHNYKKKIIKEVPDWYFRYFYEDLKLLKNFLRSIVDEKEKDNH